MWIKSGYIFFVSCSGRGSLGNELLDFWIRLSKKILEQIVELWMY